MFIIKSQSTINSPKYLYIFVITKTIYRSQNTDIGIFVQCYLKFVKE